MVWALATATVRGDNCELDYKSDTPSEDGSPRFTRQLHKRGKVPDGEDQTNEQWFIDIRRKVLADLEALNVPEPEAIDVTLRVRPSR